MQNSHTPQGHNWLIAFEALYIMQNLHTINRMSKIFECVEHGTPSGIDNFVATYGGMVLFNNSVDPPFRAITEEKVLKRLAEDVQILLVDSGVEKNTRMAVGVVRKNYEEGEKCNKNHKYRQANGC